MRVWRSAASWGRSAAACVAAARVGSAPRHAITAPRAMATTAAREGLRTWTAGPGGATAAVWSWGARPPTSRAAPSAGVAAARAASATRARPPGRARPARAPMYETPFRPRAERGAREPGARPHRSPRGGVGVNGWVRSPGSRPCRSPSRAYRAPSGIGSGRSETCSDLLQWRGRAGLSPASVDDPPAESIVGTTITGEGRRGQGRREVVRAKCAAYALKGAWGCARRSPPGGQSSRTIPYFSIFL